MRNIVSIATLLVSAAVLPPALEAQNAGTCQGMSTGPDASLNGFVPFSADSLWNTDISGAPVDPNSQNIISFIGVTTTLHPDFGAGQYSGQTIGIPYQVEPPNQPKV